MLDMLGIVDFDHGPHLRRQALDRQADENRVHVGVIGSVFRADDRCPGGHDPGSSQVVVVDSIAPDEIDAIPGGVAFGTVDQDDVGPVVFWLELIDQIAGSGVPPTYHHMIGKTGRTHTLTLLQ